MQCVDPLKLNLTKLFEMLYQAVPQEATIFSVRFSRTRFISTPWGTHHVRDLRRSLLVCYVKWVVNYELTYAQHPSSQGKNSTKKRLKVDDTARYASSMWRVYTSLRNLTCQNKCVTRILSGIFFIQRKMIMPAGPVCTTYYRLRTCGVASCPDVYNLRQLQTSKK